MYQLTSPASLSQMSEYTPLALDYEYDDAETKHGDATSSTPAEYHQKPDRSQGRNLLPFLFAIAALVAIHVFVWVFAVRQVGEIVGIIERNLDMADTRALPRPNARDGLEVLMQRKGGI